MWSWCADIPRNHQPISRSLSIDTPWCLHPSLSLATCPNKNNPHLRLLEAAADPVDVQEGLVPGQQLGEAPGQAVVGGPGPVQEARDGLALFRHEPQHFEQAQP